MKGAIFFATRYSSTAQYAEWIFEATGLPMFDVNKVDVDPSGYDFLVIGAPVIYNKLAIGKWVSRKISSFADKPVIFFSVSGAGAGSKLDGWIARSLPKALVQRMHHFALRGRQNPRDLSRFDRMMLIIAGLVNPDRQAAREELHGFDSMDKSSVEPIAGLVKQMATK